MPMGGKVYESAMSMGKGGMRKKMRTMKTKDDKVTRRGGNPHVQMVGPKKMLRLGQNSQGTSNLMGMMYDK